MKTVYIDLMCHLLQIVYKREKPSAPTHLQYLSNNIKIFTAISKSFAV